MDEPDVPWQVSIGGRLAAGGDGAPCIATAPAPRRWWPRRVPAARPPSVGGVSTCGTNFCRTIRNSKRLYDSRLRRCGHLCPLIHVQFAHFNTFVTPLSSMLRRTLEMKQHPTNSNSSEPYFKSAQYLCVDSSYEMKEECASMDI